MQKKFETTEKKFLFIAHIVVMALALVAFLAAVGGAIWSVVLMNQSVPTEMTVPKPTYSDFKAQRTTVKDKAQTLAPSNDAEYEKYKNLYINDIEASLFRFSQSADNVRTTENTPKRIFQRALQIKKFINMDVFLAELLEQSRELEKDGANIGKLNKYDKHYITWPEFLNYYFSKTMASIQEQQEKKNILRKQANTDYERGKKFLYVTGLSFLSSMFFVFYLLIFNIERNLRIREGDRKC